MGASAPLGNLDYNLGEIFTQGNSDLLKNKTKNIIKDMQYEFYKNCIQGIDYKIVKSAVINEYGLETAENLNMALENNYMNTDYAKEHTVFNNYKELNFELRTYFKDKIINQLEISNLPSGEQEKILNETKGIYIETNSKSSEGLANVLIREPDFIKIISSSKKDLDSGKTINGSIEFQDKNFRKALGKADLLDIHKDQKGNIRVLVTDVYDFDKKSENPLIKAGRALQEEGKIKPYFIIYGILIKK